MSLCTCGVEALLTQFLWLQGAQEDADADGRPAEQDEGHTVHEGHTRNTAGMCVSRKILVCARNKAGDLLF